MPSGEKTPKSELKITIHQELGELTLSEGKYGPNKVKAQIVSYGDKGAPGLNIQMFWADADGAFQYGKRPLLYKNLLEWIRDNEFIEKALKAMPDQPSPVEE